VGPKLKTPVLPKKKKDQPGMVANVSNPALGRVRQKDHKFKASLG
jgi:hypothetical protein